MFIEAGRGLIGNFSSPNSPEFPYSTVQLDFAHAPRNPYPDGVSSCWGKAMRRVALVWVVAAVLASGGLARAQAQDGESAGSESTDGAARKHFVLGRAAYRGADYEAALVHFRRAHELSGRNQLLYNVAISADRLGRHEAALQAFQKYLEGTDDPSREQEVRERIDFLRLALEESKQRERLIAEAAIHDAGAAPAEAPPRRKIPRSAIIGGSVLGAVGVAGVAIIAVGVSQNGVCLETDATGACVSQRTTSSWTAVYGGVGIAALAGSALWFGVSHRRAKRERATTWKLAPSGIVVSGTF
jgi:tetratricopeptide (TPR) repeat protein